MAQCTSPCLHASMRRPVTVSEGRHTGAAENAVKTQIWITASVYVLVAIIKKRLNGDLSLYTILQILSLTCSKECS